MTSDNNDESGEKILYQLSKRLDRFENQLIGVGDAIVQMARTEERVSVLLEQNTTLFKKVDRFQQSIEGIKIENARQKQSLSFFERVGWIVVTAAIGVVGWFARGG